MPINRAYPVSELLAAARRYAEKTGRRVVFEYALIGGVNASLADADALANLLRGMLCHVNLIPLNPVPERGLAGVTARSAGVLRPGLNDKKDFRNRAPGNGHRYRRRLRTAPQEDYA
jgi:hypothetical protein